MVTDRPGADGGLELLGQLRLQAQLLVAEVNGPLHRISLRSGDTVLEIEWPAVPEGPVRRPDEPVTRHGPAVPEPRPAWDVDGPGRPCPATSVDDRPTATPGVPVVSPIVGTFYRAAEPGASPFVEVGDPVQVGQVIGIVEAMKLMNHITAEQAGRVAEVLVSDGEPVEFEQPLLMLVPAGQSSDGA